MLKKHHLREFLKMHLTAATKIFFFNWGFAVSIYMVFVYLTSYLHSFLNVPMHRALTANTIAMLFMMCLIPLMGKLSDRIGRKPMLVSALSGFILFSFPLFALFFNLNFLPILLAMLGFAVMESMLQGVAPAAMAEVFPTRIRYTGLSVSYNTAMALFGGTAPLAATWLIKIAGNNHWMPAGYLVFSTLVGLAAVLYFKETAHEPLI